MAPNEKNSTIQLGLPKGRMQDEVFRLLSDAGIQVGGGSRAYRPRVSLENMEAKILKPQNIVEMLAIGSRDIGFAGADWVAEKEAEVVELLDTGLNPVKIVAAAPKELLVDGCLPSQTLVVASEYERLTKAWIAEQGLSATFVRSYGATEVFPPDDADCIVDNTATGSTLRANGLAIVDELMTSSTRLFANPRSLENPTKRQAVEDFIMLLDSVIEARKRVMLEVNVENDQLEQLIEVLPCMREPTVSRLHGEQGYAVKAAVPRETLATLIPQIKNRGGTDVVVSSLSQIVP